jgi:hypothetical protein
VPQFSVHTPCTQFFCIPPSLHYTTPVLSAHNYFLCLANFYIILTHDHHDHHGNVQLANFVLVSSPY